MPSTLNQEANQHKRSTKAYPCPSCSKKFQSSVALAQHQRDAKHQEAPQGTKTSRQGASADAPAASASSRSASGQQTQAKVTSKVMKTTKCPYCDRKFAAQNDLEKHSMDSRSQCHKTVASKMARSTSPTRPGSLSCAVCQQYFATTNALLQHSTARVSKCFKSNEERASQVASSSSHNARESQSLIADPTATVDKPVTLPIRGKRVDGSTSSTGAISSKDIHAIRHHARSHSLEQVPLTPEDQVRTQKKFQTRGPKDVQSRRIASNRRADITDLCDEVDLCAITRQSVDTAVNDPKDKVCEPHEQNSSQSSIKSVDVGRSDRADQTSQHYRSTKKVPDQDSNEPTSSSPYLPLSSTRWSQIPVAEHSRAIAQLHSNLHDVVVLEANRYPFVQAEQSFESAFNAFSDLVQCDICGGACTPVIA